MDDEYPIFHLKIMKIKTIIGNIIRMIGNRKTVIVYTGSDNNSGINAVPKQQDGIIRTANNHKMMALLLRFKFHLIIQVPFFIYPYRVVLWRNTLQGLSNHDDWYPASKEK